MKTGFKNKLENKTPSPSSFAFEYKAPHYDQRSGRAVKAGESYGVGHTQPVGSTTHSKGYAVPTGRVKTLNIYED